MESYEQKARDMLERCGWNDAQKCTATDVVEIANLIVSRDRLINACKTAYNIFLVELRFPEISEAVKKIEDVLWENT